MLASPYLAHGDLAALVLAGSDLSWLQKFETRVEGI